MQTFEDEREEYEELIKEPIPSEWKMVNIEEIQSLYVNSQRLWYVPVKGMTNSTNDFGIWYNFFPKFIP